MSKTKSEDSNHYLMIWSNAEGRKNDGENRNISASEGCLLKIPEKGQQINIIIANGKL